MLSVVRMRVSNAYKKAIHDGLLHRIIMHEDRHKNLLVAEVHLFSDSETPRYGVILGELA